MGTEVCDSTTKKNKVNQSKTIPSQNSNNNIIHLLKPNIIHSEKISFLDCKNFLYYKCGISSSILDDQGTTKTGWRKGAKSGPPGYLKDYIPPEGWIAIGLKVVNLYDHGNNEWIGTNNTPGEWYIGYHGVKTIDAIQNIYSQGFRRGDGQLYKNYPNINPLNKNRYPTCGEGVYFTPDIIEAESYAQFIMYNNYNYKIVFMCRINPKYVKIADLGKNKEYWIVEGDKLGDLYGQKRSDVVRPYRILFKREAVQNKNKENNLIMNAKTNINPKTQIINNKNILSLNNNKIYNNNNISNFKTINKNNNFYKNNYSKTFNNNLNNNNSNHFINIKNSITQKYNNNKNNYTNKNNNNNFINNVNRFNNNNNYPDIKLNKTTFDYSKNNTFNLNKKKNTNYIFGNNNIYKNNRFYNNDFYPDIKLNHNKLNYSYNNSYINYNKNIRNRNNYFPDIKLNNSFFDYSKKNSNVNRRHKDDFPLLRSRNLLDEFYSN